jgi:hypothetical protein
VVTTNKQDSILFQTHQAWKYNASLAIDWLGITIAGGSFYFYNSHPQWHLLGLIAAVTLFFAGFIIALGIRCPECGSRWYLRALKAPLGGGGLAKLRSQNACPACGLESSRILKNQGHEEPRS